MDKNGNLVLKQGKLVPDAALGFGLILYIPVIMLFNFILPKYHFEVGTTFFILLYAAAILSFKRIVFNTQNPDSFQVQYMIWGYLPVQRNQNFDSYTYFIIKPTSKAYGVGSVVSVHLGKSRAVTSEKYVAIFGKNSESKEVQEICKGTQEQLDEVIKHFIIPNNFPIFAGVPKKGFEYKPKN